jgi:transcriptional regulator with XRE-family HTH domain
MWKQIIDQIVEAGMTEREIAERCGCTQPTVNRLRSGVTKEPGYSIGKHLMELAGKQCRCSNNETEAA